MTEIVTQVYEDVYAPRQGSLSITALVKPNAILLVGRQENIDTANELMEKLDQPVAPDTQIKVFRLLHMPASNAEQYLRNFYGARAVHDNRSSNSSSSRRPRPGSASGGDWRLPQQQPDRAGQPSRSGRSGGAAAATGRGQDGGHRSKCGSSRCRTRWPPTCKRSCRTRWRCRRQGTPASSSSSAPAQTDQADQISRSVQIVGIDQAGNKIIESGLLTDVTITADDNSNALGGQGSLAEHGIDRGTDQAAGQDPRCRIADQGLSDQERRRHELDRSCCRHLFGQQVTAGQVGVFSQTVGRTFGTQQQLSADVRPAKAR